MKTVQENVVKDNCLSIISNSVIQPNVTSVQILRGNKSQIIHKY